MKNQLKEQNTPSDEKKNLSPWTKRLISIFLVSDINHPKLRHELRAAKKEIVMNFDWANVKSEYINRLFRTYDKIWKDIYIPPHLKKHIPKFNVQIAYDDKVREMNLKSYLSILKDIRSSLTYLKDLQSEIQFSIDFDPDQEIRTEWHKSLDAEQYEEYLGLYQKKLNAHISEIKEKISGSTFTLQDIVQLYVFSLSLHKETSFSFKQHLDEHHMQKEFSVGDLNITLKDFIRILKDIKIEHRRLP